ncbi:hypothetical protein HY477_00085 [Candidatus Uhrbacteria bacterium]|nr:hypothetical protein [Candidatus Uhrbacteria bacterium]
MMNTQDDIHNTKHGITSIFDDNFVSNLNSIASLSDKTASNALLTIGIVGAVSVVMLKSSWTGAPLKDLDTWEFAAFIWVSALLIIFGSWMRLYQYRITREMKNNIVKAQVDIARFCYGRDEGRSILNHKYE